MFAYVGYSLATRALAAAAPGIYLARQSGSLHTGHVWAEHEDTWAAMLEGQRAGTTWRSRRAWAACTVEQDEHSDTRQQAPSSSIHDFFCWIFS